MKETTSFLNKITLGERSNFTWGEAIKIHKIGEYAIVEYYPHIYKGSCSTSEIDYSTTRYSCYINGNDIGRGTQTLDFALACCIAYKHDGVNTRADSYFMKMISPTPYTH